MRQPNPYLLEVDAHNGTGVVTLRLSTHSLSTAPSDNPPNTFYDGRISDVGGIEMLIWEDGGVSGRAAVDHGFVDFSNADGVVDNWAGYGWGRQALIKVLSSADAPVSGATMILRGVVSSVESPDALHSLRLRLLSRMAELDVPLLTTRYLGTTTSIDSTDLAEGDVELKDTIKPHIYGYNLNVPGILVNKVLLFYQFADNPVNSITPYDGGINDGFGFVGDFGSLTGLAGATVAPGNYATCLAKGMVRFGTPPSFEITADVVEGTASTISAARIMQRMLALVPTIVSGDIDTTSFDALHAYNSAAVGIYISTDATAVDLLSQVADSVAGAVYATTAGQFRATYNAGPSATVDATLTLRDLIADGGTALHLAAAPPGGAQGAPAWKVIVRYGHIWRTQTAGQLAPRIAEATTGADLARKQLVALETLSAVASDATVKTQHPLASEVTVDTLLVNQADALAFAAQRLAIYKMRRDHLDFPVSISGTDLGNVPLGRSVRVQLEGRGRYHAGVDMLVLGRVDDYTRRRRLLHLWG